MAQPPAYPPYQQPIVSREGRVSTVWHRFFLSLVTTGNLVDLVPPLVPPVTPGVVAGTGYWTPISNGDPLAFELLYTADTGACVVGFVPTEAP